MNSFCKKHFIENIERRVKRDVRQNSLIQKNEKLIVKDPLCRHFIEDVLNVPVEIKRSGKGREVLLWTMDDELLEFLTALFRGRKHKRPAKNRIRLFRTVNDRELEAYANLKRLKFSRKRTKEEKGILKEIDRLEKEHKETRFSLLKSIEELNRL
ncbi:hypothetical protein GF345_03505 [Candidatus Woesearchaeota archaeon]|nr:hypothetical protein [Candidatus Woesearchaeota archaeon]